MKKAMTLLLLFSFYLAMSQQKEANVFDVARYGNLQQIDSLYKASPEVIENKNRSGYTPLILACYRGNNEVAEYIAAKTTTLNYCSENGTALAATVFRGELKLSEKLLGLGADPNISDGNGTTPLIYAVQFQNLDLVQLLLDSGADKTQKDKSGKSPFEYAIATKNQQIINLLKN